MANNRINLRAMKPAERARLLKQAGVSEADLKSVLRTKGNKYHAVKTRVDGVVFDSKREATRHSELLIMLRAGLIRDLERQVPYQFVVNGEWVGDYTSDHEYVVCATGEKIVEDSKSPATRTEAYQLRKRLMLACHGILIREV